MANKWDETGRWAPLLYVFVLLFGICSATAAFCGESPFSILKKASSLVDTIKKATGEDEASKEGTKNTSKAASKNTSQNASGKAVNVILKNNSSSGVDVELVDQYGGNFTAAIDGGMSQNHTLKAGSEVKVNGAAVHVVAKRDEGREVVVAGQ